MIDPGSDAWIRTEELALMFRDTAAVLVEADPAGLVIDGDPPDEYDVRAAQIVRLVLTDAESHDDALRIVSEVLAHYLGGSLRDGVNLAIAHTVWRRYLEVQEDR